MNSDQAGKVLSQQPSAGTTVQSSTTVTINTGVLPLGPP
ncbi:PASTA domain-containing protein [Nocardia sp. NPDC003345]